MWTLLQSRQFESSPSTQISKKRSSSSVRSCTVSSETERTRRGSGTGGSWAAGVTGPGSSGGGSPTEASAEGGSSNGRSKSESIKLLLRIADPRDFRRAPGLVVGHDDRAIQPRVARRRLELRRQAVEKARQRRFAFHPDDRIVRPCHA